MSTGVGELHSYWYDELARVIAFRDSRYQITDSTTFQGDTIWDPWGDCPSCFIAPEDSVIYIWGVATLDTASYSYDKIANRTDSATFGTQGRLTAMRGWTITHDSAGNILKRKKGNDSLTYKWNALGQLVRVTSTAPAYTVTYGYDGLGRRVRKTVNDTATHYLLDGDRVVVELNNTWSPQAKYTYYPGTDTPHSITTASGTFYYVQDAQGNVTGLISAATGGVAQTYEYGAYGERRTGSGSISQPYQFKGREWDAEAQLYFMRARYYDPMLGRFISEDPIGLAGGINPTAFVGGDPVNLSDPSGLCPVCLSQMAASVVNYLSGPAFDQLNPRGFVVSNMSVRLATVALYGSIVQALGHDRFTFIVTGGDRYWGKDKILGTRPAEYLAVIRSRTDHSIVWASSSTSFHLESRGASAIDFWVGQNTVGGSGLMTARQWEKLIQDLIDEFFDADATDCTYASAPHCHVETKKDQ